MSNRVLRIRAAFSMVELLTVLSVMAILIGLLLPAVQQARAAAARLSCQSNIRQLGTALHHYHSQHGSLLPNTLFIRGQPGQGGGALRWMTSLLPYVEQEALAAATATASQAQSITYMNPPHVGMAQV